MKLECQQCDNARDFYLVWDFVEVRQELDEEGLTYGTKEMSLDDTDKENADIECACCGVRSLVVDLDEEEDEED